MPKQVARALEHLVSGIVDNPEDVSVREKRTGRGELLKVMVNPDDLGRVIGRGGRTATSLRTVVHAISPGVRVDFVDVTGR